LAINVVCIGEFKIFRNGSFTDEDKGELLTFVGKIFEAQPFRTLVYAFITDTKDIQFFRIIRDSTTLSNQYETTGVLSLSGPGKICLIGLVTRPVTDLGFELPIFTTANSAITLEKVLGEGLTSTVYKGFTQQSQGITTTSLSSSSMTTTLESRQYFAIKKFKKEYEYLCSREVSTLSQIQSLHVPKVIFSFQTYFVMEPVGETVDKTVLFSQHARALVEFLGQVHKTGIVHRDIRPDNLILGKNSLLLIDWGFSTVENKIGPYTGTIHYASSRILQSNKLFSEFHSLRQDDLHSIVRTLRALTLPEFHESVRVLFTSDREKIDALWEKRKSVDKPFQQMCTACDAADYEQLKIELATCGWFCS